MDVASFCHSLSFFVPLQDQEVARLSKLFLFHLLLDGNCSFEVDRHLLWFVPNQSDGSNVDATQMPIKVLLLLPMKNSELDEEVKQAASMDDDKNDQLVDNPALLLCIQGVYYLFDHTAITTITVPNTNKSTTATSRATTMEAGPPPCIFLTLPYLQMRWWRPLTASTPNRTSSSKDVSSSTANARNTNNNDGGKEEAIDSSTSHDQTLDPVASLHSVLSILNSHLLPLTIGQIEDGAESMARQCLPASRASANISGMRESVESGTIGANSSKEEGRSKRQRTEENKERAAEKSDNSSSSNNNNSTSTTVGNGSSETPQLTSHADKNNTSPGELSTDNSSGPISTSQPSQHSTTASESTTSSHENDAKARQVQQRLLAEYPQARVRLQQSLRHWLHVALCLERLSTVPLTPDAVCSSWLDSNTTSTTSTTSTTNNGNNGDGDGKEREAYIGANKKIVVERSAAKHLLNIAQCRTQEGRRAYLAQQRYRYLLKAHRDKENYASVANYLRVYPTSAPISASDDSKDDGKNNSSSKRKSSTGKKESDTGMPSSILSFREARHISLTLDSAIEKERSEIRATVEKMSTANEGEEKEGAMMQIRQQVQRMEELFGEASMLEALPKREFFYERWEM